MNKKSVAPLMVLLLIALLLSMPTKAYALPAARPALQSTLPQITFLGQGPQTFTVEPPLKLLVKTYENGQFLFVPHDETSYTAASNERVWTIDFMPDEPIRLFDEEISYGNVEAGCVVNYVQIEDNPDTRRNTFYINGNVLQVVEQGWVTYGSFVVPESGELTFFAEDSIGMVIEICQTAQTVVPSETPTVEVTQTATATATLPVQTATSTSTGTVTLMPTFTSTAPGVVISLTPTETLPVGTVTLTPVTQTPSPTATTSLQTPSATPENEEPSPTSTAPMVEITATPIGTVGSFPITGGGPGPREVALTSLAILGLFVVVVAGWWFLLRTYLQRR